MRLKCGILCYTGKKLREPARTCEDLQKAVKIR